MVPATQIEAGKGVLQIYFSKSEEKIGFSAATNEVITVGNLDYFSVTQSEVEGTGKSDAYTAKYIVNPYNGLQYWILAGIAGYELSIPSGTVTNRLNTQDKGWQAGTGVRLRLFPDTIVSPAVSAEIGFTYSVFGLGILASGNEAARTINNQIEFSEVQSAIIVSKRLKNAEVYGGLKVARSYALLKDNDALQNVSGIKDSAGAVAGIRFRMYPKEFIVVEGSAFGETNISVGWGIAF